MIKEIREECIWANYLCVKIASDALQKRIILYKNNIVDIDDFNSEVGG